MMIESPRPPRTTPAPARICFSLLQVRDEPLKQARLLTELGSNVRLIHGSADGLLGSLGSPPGIHYRPMLPDLARCVSALVTLEFGQAAPMPAT